MKLDELTQNLFILPQLNEGFSPEDISIIEKDCQPFLNEIGGIDNLFKYPMFRGSRTKNVELTLKRSYIDSARKPLQTTVEIHNYLNVEFNNKFGVPFRNGYFATGKSFFAEGYGHVHYCIPKGEFKYCWSPSIKDLYDEIQKVFSARGKFYMSDVDINDPDDQDTIRSLVNKYKTTDLLEAIKSGKEIMIYNDLFYMEAV